MRTFSYLAGAALVLGVAGIAMAASPAPSASPSPSTAPTTTTTTTTTTSSSATPAAKQPSGTSTSGTSSSSAATSWSAAIKPLDATAGTATVAEGANGTGTITLKLTGLRPDAAWTVDVDGGTIARSMEVTKDEIASRAGIGVDRVASDTVRISLGKAEMQRFLSDRTATGVVVLVSDGTNRSAAVFPAG